MGISDRFRAMICGELVDGGLDELGRELGKLHGHKLFELIITGLTVSANR